MSGFLLLDAKGDLQASSAGARGLLGLPAASETRLPYREIAALGAVAPTIAAALHGTATLPVTLPLENSSSMIVTIEEIDGAEGRALHLHFQPGGENGASFTDRRQLQAAIDALPDGFVLFDPHDRLQLFNESFRKIYGSYPLGLTYEEGLRQGLARGLYAEAVGREEEWLEARLDRHRNPGPPLEQPTADGRWIRILERRLADGSTVGLRIDITDLKHREQALQDSERRLRQIMDLSQDCIVCADDQGRIVDVNRAAEATFGYRRDEAVGRDVVELGVPERLQLLERQFLDGFRRTGQAPALGRRITRTLKRADGSEFPCEFIMMPTEHSGRRLILLYMRDISERVQIERALRHAYEEAEAGNRAKTAFLAQISHELRTPLNAIVGLSSLLGAGDLPRAEAAHVSLIEQAAARLTQLIDDILDHCRHEAGTLEVDPRPFALRTVVNRTFADAQSRPEAERLDLAMDLHAACPETVIGDAVRLDQVLHNLLANAVKFTERGEVRLAVGPAGHGNRNVRLRFEVSDTGPGLSDELRRRLFAPFETGTRNVMHGTAGAGLGLSICKRLVELMGGQIGVDSTLGKGSTFWFELPFDLPEQDCATSPVRPLRVLVADSVTTNQVLLKALLERLGHAAEVAPNEPAALARLREASFDLIVSNDDSAASIARAAAGTALPALSLSTFWGQSGADGRNGHKRAITLSSLKAAIDATTREHGTPISGG